MTVYFRKMGKKNKKNKNKSNVQNAENTQDEQQMQTGLQSLQVSATEDPAPSTSQTVDQTQPDITPETSPGEHPPSCSSSAENMSSKLSGKSSSTPTPCPEQDIKGSIPGHSSVATLSQTLATTSKENREQTKEQRRNQPQIRFGTSSEPGKITCELAIPKRGGPKNAGKEGSIYPVHVNHFPLKISDQKKIHHYDVEITTPWKRENQRRDEPFFRRGYRQLRHENSKTIPPFTAFDGIQSMYTTRKLAYTGDSWTGKVKITEDTNDDTKMVELSFKIKLVTELKLKPLIRFEEVRKNLSHAVML